MWSDRLGVELFVFGFRLCESLPLPLALAKLSLKVDTTWTRMHGQMEIITCVHRRLWPVFTCIACYAGLIN